MDILNKNEQFIPRLPGRKSEPDAQEEEAIAFLMDLWQQVWDGRGDQQIIYSYLQKNLPQLNEGLVRALPKAANKLFKKKSPQNAAWMLVVFANVLSDFPLGQIAIWSELAIGAYSLALQVYTRDAFPKNWAITQNNLGNIYLNRIRGERADNLEQAIAAYQLALQVCKRDAFPQDWAMTQMNLGNAYRDRIRGERADNLEQAIAAYQLALQVYTQDAFPQSWAGTQVNLGNAYRDRIRGERADNLKKAIAAYQFALQVYTRDAVSQDWALTQGNLASSLMDRAQLNQDPKDLDQAIDFFQSALDIAAPGSDYAISHQYQVGRAWARRYEISQNSVDLQQAVQAYQTALTDLSSEHYDRPQLWQALPEIQAVLGRCWVREGRWQEGLQLLLNSLNQLSQSEAPHAHATALFETAQGYETLSDWDNARLYYRDALRLYEHLDNPEGIARSLNGLGGVLVSQGHFQKGMAHLDKARQLYLQLGHLEQAAEAETLYQVAERAWHRYTQEISV